MSMRHPFDTELALYAGRDLSGWKRVATALHVRNCADCRASVEAFREIQQQWVATADELPEDINWNKLSAEMTANIHLGIAAGECVAPARERSGGAHPAWHWQPAAVVAGLVLVFAGAWWLNMPPRTTQALGNAWNHAVHPTLNVNPYALDDHGPVVAASLEGIEYSENGSRLSVNMKEAPVAVSVSFNGSASARYVNEDTGVVTIATVYGQ